MSNTTIDFDWPGFFLILLIVIFIMGGCDIFQDIHSIAESLRTIAKGMKWYIHFLE